LVPWYHSESAPDRRPLPVCNFDYNSSAPHAEADTHSSNWERFQSGTRGPRRRLLTPRREASERTPIEASETFPGRVVAGSFRKLGFYSTKSGACKGGNTPVLVQERRWSHLYRIHWPDGVISAPANLTRCKDAIRNWVSPHERPGAQARREARRKATDTEPNQPGKAWCPIGKERPFGAG